MRKRKTKAQKKIAELRHKLTYQIDTIVTTNASSSVQEPQKKLFYKLPEHIKQIHDTSPSYGYLKKDLSKTALLSSAIIIFQVLLLLFLKMHGLHQLGLQY